MGLLSQAYRPLTMNKVITGILWILAIFIFAYLIYEFVLYFTNAEKDIKAAVIGVIGLSLVAVFSHYFAQKREIASRHFSEKVKAFEGIFNLIFEMTSEAKKRKKMNEQEIHKRALIIKKDLMIWAGPDVINAWKEFESLEESEANIFKYMDNLFLALRKELGHRDTNLAQGDLVKLMIKASDHSMVDEQMRKD